ncbi:unnamed protein product [Candidula unifasciata]|uniref:Protoheme IX farnesyltransferase, mitochondrial n=1 Tax=Candidula unifasciata TaxID=100452 RepID=A0A8S3YQ37_9EUPU|nr:unnamed protein product [Candidula unifasciata]
MSTCSLSRQTATLTWTGQFVYRWLATEEVQASREHTLRWWSRKSCKCFFATKAAATTTSPAPESAEEVPHVENNSCVTNHVTKNVEYIMRTVDIEKHEPLTLHFKKSGQLIDIKASHISENTSLFLQGNRGMYHLDKLSSSSMSGVFPAHSVVKSPSSYSLTVFEARPDRSNPGSNIESVHDVEWRDQKLEPKKLFLYYKMLSKARLTGLVVITTMAGYGISPGAFDLSVFVLSSLGTCLTSCAANSINQFFEVPYDSQMNRTKNRVLVKGLLSPLHSVGFAAVSSISGLCILYYGVNPVVAGLGAFNLGLYTLIYTPLKRISVINTWVGSLVGAIPPMMGWAACTGGLEPGAFLLAGILYSWQFPHFNALSWNLRPDYSRAGYRMMSVVDPSLCQSVALRHCILLTGMCLAAPLLGVTSWMFAADSLPLNMYLCYLGWRFYRKGDSNSSRKLFRFTLIHIPALLLLMGISKASFGGQNKEDKDNKINEEFGETAAVAVESS